MYGRSQHTKGERQVVMIVNNAEVKGEEVCVIQTMSYINYEEL